MILLLLLLLIFIVGLCIFRYPKLEEHFQSLTPHDKYNAFTLDSPSQPKPILDFMEDVDTTYKNLAPSSGPFRGSCDDKVNQLFQNKAVRAAFSHVSKKPLEKHDCPRLAASVCTFTDPALFLGDHQGVPFDHACYKTHLPPSTVNLTCYNSLVTCCARAASAL